MPIIFEGQKYYPLQEVKQKFKVPQPTLYYWASNGKCLLLDVESACEGTPFSINDIRHQYYFEEDSLLSAIRELRGEKGRGKLRH